MAKDLASARLASAGSGARVAAACGPYSSEQGDDLEPVQGGDHSLTPSTASVVGKPKTSNTSGNRKWSIATMAPARALTV